MDELLEKVLAMESLLRDLKASLPEEEALNEATKLLEALANDAWHLAHPHGDFA